MISSFVVNWALLVALTQVYNRLVVPLRVPSRLVREIVHGLVFGAIAIVAMLYPVRVFEDAILDGRIVVIALSVPFAGPVAGAVATVIAVGYRVYIGGVGLTAGLITNTGAYLIGLLFMALVRVDRSRLRSLHFLAVGLAVTLLTAIAALIAYPLATALALLKSFIAILGLFYVATAWLFGELLADYRRSEAVRTSVADSERRYRELFQHSPALVAVVDDQMRLVDVNDTVVDRFGHTREYLVGRSILDLMDDESRRHVREMMALIVAGESAPAAEYTFLASGDRRIRLYAKGGVRRPVETADGSKGFLTELIDVSELRASQARERAQREELYQAAKLASLGTLVSGVAHEINNPNNFIRMSVDNLEDFWIDARSVLDDVAKADADLTLGGIAYDRARDMAGTMITSIRGGSERIARLVADLKDFSRKGDSDAYESVDVRELVTAAQTIIGSTIRAATDSFRLEMPDEPIIARCNPQRIEQVIINLVSNACQALRDRSQSVCVRVAGAGREPWIELHIEDEGCGIDAETIRSITDPFFTTRRSEGGTGLGLAITHRIVSDHGGTIEFASNPGGGTHVTVRLPATPVDDPVVERVHA